MKATFVAEPIKVVEMPQGLYFGGPVDIVKLDGRTLVRALLLADRRLLDRAHARSPFHRLIHTIL